MYTLLYSKQAKKDARKLKASGLKQKAGEILPILRRNPFENPPRFEKLVGDLQGAYSRRLNIQHRIVYQVREKDRYVRILRMWSHYE